MRLVRSNDDPTLIADLERMAGIAGEKVEDRPGDDGAYRFEEWAATPIEDPFVRRVVQGSLHLRKYAPFYAGVGLWAMAMLIIQPVGSDRPNISEVAQPTGVRRASVAPAAAVIPQAEPDAAGSPVFYSAGASSFSSDDVSATSAFPDDMATSEPPPSSQFGSEPASPDFTEPELASSADATPPKKPISIVASGYSSSTGGTPLEQDPGSGGLPVGAAGGSDTKRSFVRLAGDETTLRLKEAASGNVAPDRAAIKACPISTSSWTPGRGQALSAGPAYDNGCVAGTRATSGVWTFDLARFAPLGAGNGFALTTASATGLTFQVVLAPTAVAAS